MRNLPFANRSASDRKAERECDAKRFAELRESLTRLVKNEDFRMWFRYVVFVSREEYGVEHEMGAYCQGGLAMIATLKDSLAIADGGPEFLAELTRRHFTTVANAKIEAQREKNENGE